jgi:hypothetical protein
MRCLWGSGEAELAHRSAVVTAVPLPPALPVSFSHRRASKTFPCLTFSTLNTEAPILRKRPDCDTRRSFFLSGVVSRVNLDSELRGATSRSLPVRFLGRPVGSLGVRSLTRRVRDGGVLAENSRLDDSVFLKGTHTHRKQSNGLQAVY